MTFIVLGSRLFPTATLCMPGCPPRQTPRVRCRKAFVIVLRYLLTYLKERDGARRAAELTRTDFASLARVPIGCLSNRPRRPCTPSQALSSLILRLRFTAIKLLLCLVVQLIVHLLLVALLVLHSA